MTVPPIVHGLPYMAWIVLVTLALGAFAFVALTRQLSDATRGYLGTTAVLSAALAGLALAVDIGLTTPPGLVVREGPPELEFLRRTGLVAFALLALAYVLALRGSLPVLPTALATLAAGALAIVAAAFGWAPAAEDGLPLLVQLTVLSLATGGSMAAIALGHWYLVTPKLSVEPLVLQTRWLLATVGLQLLLFVTWATLGGGPGQEPFEAFSSGNVLIVVLRLAVTLLFPLVLVYMALRTAQTRSMESATGLLYINLAAVMAGTIGAGALYVSGGLLV